MKTEESFHTLKILIIVKPVSKQLGKTWWTVGEVIKALDTKFDAFKTKGSCYIK